MHPGRRLELASRTDWPVFLVLAALPLLVAVLQLAIFTRESTQANLFLYLLMAGLCTGKVMKMARNPGRPASWCNLPRLGFLGVILLRDVVCIGALIGVATTPVAMAAVGITGSFWGLCLASLASINEDFFAAIFGKTIGFLYLMGWVAATSVVSFFLISAAKALSGADAMNGWFILVVINLATFLLLLTVTQSPPVLLPSKAQPPAEEESQ